MKLLFIFTAALLLVAAASSAVCAQAIQQIDVINFGIYRGDRIKQEDAPATPAGVLGQVANLELTEETTMIPVLRGVSFGFEFKIKGQIGTKVSNPSTWNSKGGHGEQARSGRIFSRSGGR